MSLSKILGFRVLLPAALLYSAGAAATCPPIVPCKTTAEASTIAGSNADQELIQFTQDITTSTNEVAEAIMNMANANASSLASSAQQIIATNAEMSQIRLNQDLKKAKAMSDREMSHKQHMTELAYRASATVVSPDDTKEEFELILETLDENSELSVPEIVLILQETVDKDDENGKVLVQLPASQGVCSEEDVNEEGKCAIAKRVFPGKKLQALFKQCSVQKRMLKEMQASKEARVAAATIANKDTGRALEITDSAGAVGARMVKQQQLSCTPAEFKNGLCGGTSAEDYQEDILIGNIVPGGDVSASNFNSPSESSASGFIDDLPDDVKQDLLNQSLNRVPLNEDPNQRVVPIQHTYRNANQVMSALSFIDNLVADDIVPALSPTDRRKVQNAEYQSRHLSRVASLSMVRLVLSESMSQRVGEEMRKMILDGEFDDATKFEIAADSPDNKESVLGAGPLDILQDRVNQQAANLQTGDQNGASGNAGNDFIANPSDNDALEKVNDSLLLGNEMLMKEALMNEQLITLEAISVAQMANSAEMIRLMERLRRGK